MLKYITRLLLIPEDITMDNQSNSLQIICLSKKSLIEVKLLVILLHEQ